MLNPGTLDSLVLKSVMLWMICPGLGPKIFLILVFCNTGRWNLHVGSWSV